MQIHKARWFWLVFLCLSTHALLDSFTVYGTQLIWPLSDHPFAISNIFIIDPLYTLPLLLAFLCTLIPKIHTPRIYKINAAMLVLSSLYLCSSLILKVIINNKIDAVFAHKHIHINNYVSTPAPLTTLLWRVVAMSDGQYYISYASVFDSPEEVTINRYNTSPALLNDIKNEWGIKRLQWFTKGFYSVKEQQNKIVLSDLRMGMECYYVFNFAVGEKTNKGVQVSNFEKLNQRSNLSSLSKVWDRIWSPDVSLAPPYADKNCMKTP